MVFEWDESKNRENILKHGVSFDEAQKAFYDPLKLILKDKKHSFQEDRFYCIGEIENEIITVRFTFRDGNIRIFGAGYWRKENLLYKKQNSLL